MAAELIYTGVPCKRGHDSHRYKKFGGCVQCVKEANDKAIRDNKEMRAQSTRNWRQNNRKHSNEWRVNWNLKNPERRMLFAARKAAKTQGIPFNISLEDIKIPDRCPVLGMKLERALGSRVDSSPSLDKIIPSLGYTKGNVMVISWRANRLKADASFDEMFAIAKFYRKLASKN